MDHEYAFDITLTAALRVMAPDVATARGMVAAALDCANANFGAWPDGRPILAEVNLDSVSGLFEVNGVPAISMTIMEPNMSDNMSDNMSEKPATSRWTFTANLRVWDPKQLVEAARAHPDAAGMPTEDFYGADGEVDINACLVMMLDRSMPGATIEASWAEEIE